MFRRFERKIAFRYFGTSRKEGFISLIAGFSSLGICLGVATLIIVMAVMNGFRAELTKQILGFNGHLRIYSATYEGITDYKPLVSALKKTEGVVYATPLVERQIMVMQRNIATGALVHGIAIDDLQQRKLIIDNIRMGSIETFDQENSVVIGWRMAEKFRVFPGEQLTIVAPQGTPTAFGTIPRMKKFRVSAIFDVGMHIYDSSTMFIPIATAQQFFNLGDAATEVEVFTTNPDNLQNVRSKIESILAPNFQLQDWQQSNAAFFNTLEVERNVMFIILALMTGIAAFNIISSLFMLVTVKGHDIAIMRTMGATRSMILRIFFLTGASIGVLGTIVGVILGLTFSLNIETIRQWIQLLTGTELFRAEIYFLSQLPAKVNPSEVIIVVIVALGLSFLATIPPAWRAARLDPVKALRYE